MMTKVMIVVAALLVRPSAASAAECGPSNINECGVVVVDEGPADFRGAIVVPGSEAANRAVVASGGCEGCEWTLVRECDLNTPQDPGYVNCLAGRCPDGDVFRIYLKRPSDPAPVYLDTICLTNERRVVTAAEIGADVERHVTRLAPAPHAIAVQAPGVAVVNLPAYFAASGPERDSRTLDVTTAAGPARLRIDVGPQEYAWTFGDGASCVTGERGGAWDGDRSGGDRCDTRVAHRFATPGTPTVSLTVRWSGTYTFDVGYGPVGPLPIPGNGVTARPVTAAVRVAEARAELVGGDRH